VIKENEYIPIASLRKAFSKLDDELNVNGVSPGKSIPRILISKKDLTQSQLKRLGFVGSLVAIPERGQQVYSSYRHPLSNHHIHDHGNVWTMHEDKHSSVLMSLERLKKSNNKTISRSTSPTGIKGKDIDIPESFSAAIKQGLLHTGKEGLLGAAIYLKNIALRSKKWPDIIRSMEMEKDSMDIKMANGSVIKTVKINKGDLLLGGRFKNIKTIVKDFGTDAKGQPTINGRKLFAFRINKLMPKGERSVPDVVKQAFVGTMLGKVTQPSREINYSTDDLNRFKRKHPSLKMPKLDAQIDINKGLDTMSGSFAIIEGHELGHTKDFVTKGEKFLGDRGIFGLGGIPETKLAPEASASNHIIKELPPKIKRTHGKELAHAYDTYSDSAKIDPSGKSYGLDIPQEHKKSVDVLKKAKSGFVAEGEKYYPEVIFDHKSVDVFKRMREKGISEKGQSHEKYITDVVKRKNRKGLINHLSNKKDRIAFNRSKLIDNLKKMDPSDNEAIKKETFKYIRETRDNFGNDVAKGVIDDVRSLRKDYYKKYPKKLIEKGVKVKKLNSITKVKSMLAKILRKGK